MSTSGVCPEGFIAKSLETIKSEMDSEIKANVDPRANTSTDSLLGQVIGVPASKIAEVWELSQAAFNSFNLNNAEGFQLNALLKMFNRERLAPQPSTVSLELVLDPGTTVPSGSEVSVSGDVDAKFATDAGVTNGGGVQATFTVAATAPTVGPTVANANTVTNIISTVAGWVSVNNPLDASVGTNEETDAEYRARHLSQLASNGSGTPDAIRAQLVNLTGMQSATIFENTTDSTDADGLPPHSFEAVVFDGTSPAVADNDIAQAIWDAKPAGIATHGTSSGTAVDDNSQNRTVNFSRPTTVDVYLEFDLTVNQNVFGTGGSDLVKEVVAAFGDANIGVGDSVILSALCAEVFKIAGVEDITATRVGTAPSPVQTTNLTVASREIADLDTSRIVVNT